MPVASAQDLGILVDLTAVGASRSRGSWDDHALTAIYRTHYAPLVRQSALLVGDAATAEDVVQDSFAAVYCAWWRLRDHARAVHYLRRSVLNRSRSVLRHRAVAARPLPVMPPDVPSAEDDAVLRWERSQVASALALLSPRQREALVLRYYADLPEAEVAAAMGISAGAVKSHTSRAMDALRTVLADAVAGPATVTGQEARAGQAHR
jgi:RNA polymerase sigma-70 factor (sigma-E family)